MRTSPRPALARNFSGGPGALPRRVLEQAQEAVLELPNTGVSILGLSHRSERFRAILDEAEERVRRLAHLPKTHHVLFLQGGGTLQFSMIPLTMLPPKRSADYLVTGYWSKKSVEAARYHGQVRVAWNGEPDGFRCLPGQDAPLGASDAAYLHYVSNETVDGLQFPAVPSSPAPIVCDASSDFLSRPCDMSRVSLLYAHAQKNLGPAGVTIVLVDEQVLAHRPSGLPPILDYRAHADARSLLHTPAVFSCYVVLLSLRWLEDDMGGLVNMGRINHEKAAMVREALRLAAPFYTSSVEPACASDMNVVFRCPTPALDARFVEHADSAGLVGTKGHRSRGGLRISLYNGVTLEDARAMAQFLLEFAHQHRDQVIPAPPRCISPQGGDARSEHVALPMS